MGHRYEYWVTSTHSLLPPCLLLTPFQHKGASTSLLPTQNKGALLGQGLGPLPSELLDPATNAGPWGGSRVVGTDSTGREDPIKAALEE